MLIWFIEALCVFYGILFVHAVLTRLLKHFGVMA